MVTKIFHALKLVKLATNLVWLVISMSIFNNEFFVVLCSGQINMTLVFHVCEDGSETKYRVLN